ncbi:unnamed protein product [Penicillium salamii]|uniref:Nucleotidyl transferase AbiEii toxin, Type IV TA system n=1 Tax=Penicillium salamii TaxID=1612424 RepID=A0A9W4NC65_9EURO|nr:unnamed protein product [Penicillium salamii]CAG8226450.1 unnamed protein product [Penicillium salamii]CAG8327781.1 unnamed protein product [Penicillium salamii]CAG8360223.1 unnamed protein product [Penicillium salamii]CAG8361256.1 unnamed protein product [Penicillium salamii]
MGGAASYLLSPAANRTTNDIDLVIHVDHRMTTANSLTTVLLESYPAEFEGVSQFGHTIPAYKLAQPTGGVRLVELEVFDHRSWPQRPQSNIPAATRTRMNINAQVVKLFSAGWILREKILSQYQRQGSQKEGADIGDLIRMIPLAQQGIAELDFNGNAEMQTALANLLQKRPELAQPLKAKIKCDTAFQI